MSLCSDPDPAFTPTSPLMPESNLIARQPIVDLKRAVVAYELFDRTTLRNAYDAGSDITLIFNALNHTGTELPFGKVLIFINRTHQSLIDGHLDLVQPDKVVLEIGPVPGHAAPDIEALTPVLLELAKRGFKLAFNYTVLATAYAAWQPLANYVKLDLASIKPEQLPALVTAAKSRTQAKLIAEKVETKEQFTTMAALGITLFQGYWVARPDLIKTRVVAPAQAHILKLFNLVRNQASTEEIEDVLKKDAMLGFNLMRLINSCSFGLTREITSFRQAVMLMGLKKLFRWAALLLTASRANGTPPALGTTAVVRGRMMELLASDTMTPDECDGAFMVGLFSLLGDMLGLPKEQALDLLSLPPAVNEALRHGSGIYGPMLTLTIACESHDDEAFSAAANALKFSNHHINMSHMEALIWADSLEI